MEPDYKTFELKQIQLVASATGQSTGSVAAIFHRNAALRAMRNRYRLELSPILEAAYKKGETGEGEINATLKTTLSTLSHRLYGPRPVSTAPLPRPHAADFIRLYAFHKRASFVNKTIKDDKSSQPGHAQAVLDMVTHLQNYPKLLESLGLVLEVGIVVDVNNKWGTRDSIVRALGNVLPCHGTIKVHPIWSDTSHSRCYTRFVIAQSTSAEGEKWSFLAEDPITTSTSSRGSITDPNTSSATGPGLAWVKNGYLDLLSKDNRYLRDGKDQAGQYTNADQKFHLEILDADHGGFALSLLARTLRDRPRVMAISEPPPFIGAVRQTAAQIRSVPPVYVSNAFMELTPPDQSKEGKLVNINLNTYDAQRLARVVGAAAAAAYKGRSDRVTVPGVQVLFSVGGSQAFTADVDIYLVQGRIVALVWNAIQLQGTDALDTDTPPAHKSNGISLLWSGRDQDMAQTVARDLSGKVAGANQNVFLDAGDLILGFVPYVRIVGAKKPAPQGSAGPTPPVWVSLCQRVENYDKILPSSKDTVVHMPLRMSAAKPLDTPTPPPNNGPMPDDIEERLLGEPLFGWHGESLVLQKDVQGVTLADQQTNCANDDAQNLAKVVPVAVKAVPTRRLRFSRSYAADKPSDDTTPVPLKFVPFEFVPVDGGKYRFEQYRFCVAIMDRSGQVRDPNKASPDMLPALETPYLRYQPIPAPVLLMDHERRGLTRPKISLNEMVVGGGTTEERWGVPRRADEQICEMHGVLDSDKWLNRSFNAVEFTDELKFPPDHKTGLPVRHLGRPMNQIPAPYFPDPMVRRVGWWVEGLGETVIDAVDAGGPIQLYQSGATWPEACAASFRLVETGKSTMSARGNETSQHWLWMAFEPGCERVSLPPLSRSRRPCADILRIPSPGPNLS